jgi:hypothetical protein
MKRYILLIVLLCYPALSFGAPPTSSVPISSSSSTSSTTTTSAIICANDSDCYDYNPCTSEACAGQCVYFPTSNPCDDGLYCNGEDSCENMDCSVHSGNPCPLGTVCNESTDSCDESPITSTTTSSNQGSSTTTSLPPGGSLSISGYVMGAIIEDVSILLAGTASETSISDIQGYYEFSDLASGYYTITPIKDGYNFEPPNYVIQNLVSVLENMDFRATKTLCLAQSMYGEDSNEVELLRSIRDNVLSKTQEGRELIKLYYQWSPIIVRAMEEDEEFKEEIKDIIDEILPMISQ